MIRLPRGALSSEPISPLKAKRKRHDAGFSARVAMETLKEERPFQQIAKDLDLHPMQVSVCKRKLSEEALGFFASAGSVATGADVASIDKVCDLAYQNRKVSRGTGFVA
jgi:transposase